MASNLHSIKNKKSNYLTFLHLGEVKQELMLYVLTRGEKMNHMPQVRGRSKILWSFAANFLQISINEKFSCF